MSESKGVSDEIRKAVQYLKSYTESAWEEKVAVAEGKSISDLSNASIRKAHILAKITTKKHLENMGEDGALTLEWYLVLFD